VNGDAPPKARAAALLFIFITLVLDMLALGMIVPVLPKLVEDFVHGDTARAAYIVGVFGAVWALMQFVFSPVLGALSDRYGRRPPTSRTSPRRRNAPVHSECSAQRSGSASSWDRHSAACSVKLSRVCRFGWQPGSAC
jgi:hypothetical protein